MTNRSKDKGDRAEREVERLLRELLRIPTIRRALGAGRKDDVGDIHGVPDTCIQVAWRDSRPLRETVENKLEEVEHQRLNARVRFASCFIRLRHTPWFVVMTPEQWAKLWRYAQIGIKVERQVKAARASTRARPDDKMQSRDEFPGRESEREAGREAGHLDTS